MAGKIKLVKIRELVASSNNEEAMMEYMLLKITLSGYGIDVAEI